MTVFEKFKTKLLNFIKFLTSPSYGDVKVKLRRYLLYFLIVVVINIIAGKNITHLGYPLSSNISMFLLLNINIILVIVLLLLIFRNLVKILSEQRGTLKIRLLIFSLVVTILPVTIIFIYSSQLLNDSINKWFANQVDGIANKSGVLVNDFIHYICRCIFYNSFYFSLITQNILMKIRFEIMITINNFNYNSPY